MYDAEPSHVERTWPWVHLFKNVVMGLGTLLILGFAVYWMIQGEWVFGLILVFIVEPIWLFVADLVTGILVLPFVGTAALRDRRRRD